MCMCTATYFDFIFCTATFAVLQVQLHVRLTAAIKFYSLILTYKLQGGSEKTAHFQFTSDHTDATVTDNEWRHSEVILEWGPTWQAQSASL